MAPKKQSARVRLRSAAADKVGKTPTTSTQKAPPPKLAKDGPQYDSEGVQLVRVRFANGTLLAFVLILIAVLWAAAEAHDNNCYTKASARALESAAASGFDPNAEPETTNCLILPWNEP